MPKSAWASLELSSLPDGRSIKYIKNLTNELCGQVMLPLFWPEILEMLKCNANVPSYKCIFSY